MARTSGSRNLLAFLDMLAWSEGTATAKGSDDGYNVVGEAMDGDGALEMATRLHPDIILLDVVMPKVSGVEALRSIRMVMQDVFVLMVTASTDQEVVSEVVKSGISGYIIKPFNAKKVLDTVGNVVGKVRANRKQKPAQT